MSSDALRNRSARGRQRLCPRLKYPIAASKNWVLPIRRMIPGDLFLSEVPEERDAEDGCRIP